jgi:uncharacterized protein YdeI (YjbR/CyaY-like superfamily)
VDPSRELNGNGRLVQEHPFVPQQSRSLKAMNPLKPKKPTSVDEYLAHGCGRCPLGASPECKVHPWQAELKLLRQIVLQAGLTEEVKWNVPCYTFGGKNIAVVAALKDHCSLSFFKGAGIEDPEGLLQSPGENSQAARLLRFRSLRQIQQQRPAIDHFIRCAIELEHHGYKPPSTKPSDMAWPVELLAVMESDSRFREAFEALTPGRQRGYLLFFAAAKQSKTRAERIHKHRERILSGLGLHD